MVRPLSFGCSAKVIGSSALHVCAPSAVNTQQWPDPIAKSALRTAGIWIGRDFAGVDHVRTCCRVVVLRSQQQPNQIRAAELPPVQDFKVACQCQQSSLHRLKTVALSMAASCTFALAMFAVPLQNPAGMLAHRGQRAAIGGGGLSGEFSNCIVMFPMHLLVRPEDVLHLVDHALLL